MRAAAGDLDGARVAFEDAADVFERSQTPYEGARTRLELAGVLERLGRPDAAIVEWARGEQVLAGLRESEVAAGPLTNRELEVLTLVAEGLSNAEIARRLVVSTHTVHRHIANLMRKLEVNSRTAAVSRASKLGLI